MKILDYIFVIIILLSLFIFLLYILKPKLFLNWKYRKYLINIPFILTIGIVLAYVVFSNQQNKAIKTEYNLLKKTINTISTNNDTLKVLNNDSLGILSNKEIELTKSKKKIIDLINEKRKIDRRIGADKAMLDSLNQLQITINDKLSKLKIEKTQYFKNERRTVTYGGKIVMFYGKRVVTNVKVFTCLYGIDNLIVTSKYNEIHSTKMANVLINLKFTVIKNSGDIANKSIDSLIYISFKLPNGNIEKNKNIMCNNDNSSKEISDCFKYTNLPYEDSIKFTLNISKIDTGNYHIDFFTKNCKICEYIFKL